MKHSDDNHWRASALFPRRQALSGFTGILQRLVHATPGALGAVLADEEGETVDYFGTVDPEYLGLATAYMGILLHRFSTCGCTIENGGLWELRLKGSKVQYICRPLGLGYQVTVVLESHATLPKLYDALEQAMAELRLEAGGLLI